MDAHRRGNHVVAHLDVPGVRSEDVDVTAERNVLTLRIPVAETATTRKVEVSAGSGAGSTPAALSA